MYSEELIDLLTLCPNLQHLEVECFHEDEELMPQLPVQLSLMHLEALCLHSCIFASDLLNELSMRRCNTLRVLFLDNSSVSGGAINNIASVCTGLTELRIRTIGGYLFAALDFRLLRNLTHLMLGLRDDLHARTVLSRVAMHCTKLTYLAIYMDARDPCDLSFIYDRTVLPALSILNVCHMRKCDTSVLQMHRPKLRIGRSTTAVHWHSFEDIVCNTGYRVW